MATRSSNGGSGGLLAREALAFLKEQLAEGVYRPGETLSVDNLGAQIGVSRQTVLEAMRVLAREGMISIVPQVGCQVAAHKPEEIRDFFMLFARVEGLLAGLAATRHLPHELQRLNSLRQEIGALRASTDDNERSLGHRRLNHDFHGYIHQLARSPEIARTAQSYWDRSDFHLGTAPPDALIYSRRLPTADDEHDSVVERIRARDADSAEALMRQHVIGFGDMLLQSFGQVESGAPAALAVGGRTRPYSAQ